jgi:hypothetical protein
LHRHFLQYLVWELGSIQKNPYWRQACFDVYIDKYHLFYGARVGRKMREQILWFWHRGLLHNRPIAAPWIVILRWTWGRKYEPKCHREWKGILCRC